MRIFIIFFTILISREWIRNKRIYYTLCVSVFLYTFVIKLMRFSPFILLYRIPTATLQLLLYVMLMTHAALLTHWSGRYSAAAACLYRVWDNIIKCRYYYETLSVIYVGGEKKRLFWRRNVAYFYRCMRAPPTRF